MQRGRFNDTRRDGVSRRDEQRRDYGGQQRRRGDSPPRRGAPHGRRQDAPYDPSNERGWTGGGGRGLVDNRLRRKRQREGDDTRAVRSGAEASGAEHAGDAASGAAGEGGAQGAAKAPRRRAAASAASGRLFGALFKGQLQSAKQTLESKPVAAKLAAQAAARAAAEAAEAKTRSSLAEAERSAREAQLSASQAKKRVMEATIMASRWRAHYATLAGGEYLATETQPALFWKPAKPNAASLKGLLQRRKHSQDAMAVQQPLWDEFVAQEKRAVAALLQAQASPREVDTQRVVVSVPPVPADAGAEAGGVSDDGEVPEATPVPADAAVASTTAEGPAPSGTAAGASHTADDQQGANTAVVGGSSAAQTEQSPARAEGSAVHADDGSPKGVEEGHSTCVQRAEDQQPAPAGGVHESEAGAAEPADVHVPEAGGTSPAPAPEEDEEDATAAVAALLDDEDDE